MGRWRNRTRKTNKIVYVKRSKLSRYGWSYSTSQQCNQIAISHCCCCENNEDGRIYLPGQRWELGNVKAKRTSPGYTFLNKYVHIMCIIFVKNMIHCNNCKFVSVNVLNSTITELNLPKQKRQSGFLTYILTN